MNAIGQLEKGVPSDYLDDPNTPIDILIDPHDDVFGPKDPIDPIKIPDPIRDVDPGDGGFRSFTYKGQIVDCDTGAAIPSATVTMSKNGSVIARTIADSNGMFEVYTSDEPDQITITSVGYKPYTSPASSYQFKFELEKNVKDLDPVIVQASSKNSGLMWAGLGLLLLLAMQKKKRA